VQKVSEQCRAPSLKYSVGSFLWYQVCKTAILFLAKQRKESTVVKGCERQQALPLLKKSRLV
jgi:hypothetical protein